jgi:hypothetical protein
MQIDVGREREMIPAAWVTALMEARSLDPMAVAVLTKKHLSTIYGWKRKGIEYLDWIGLLTLLEEETSWEPSKPLRKQRRQSS